MFTPVRWAKAFINSLEKEGGDIEEGIEALVVFASLASSLPGAVFGRSVAEKLEKLIRSGMEQIGSFSSAQDVALRFFLLMAKKNVIGHINAVINASKSLLDKKRGVITVSLEYAFPPKGGCSDGSFIIDRSFIDGSFITEAIKKKTGAARVRLTEQLNPDLIGGYRLRIGDEIIDASIRTQLRKLEACLAAGDGGN